MNIEEFNKAHKKFDELEKRGSFYDMALNLIKKGFDIEAYLLILSTWNFASFRYVVTNFDLVGFKKVISECKQMLEELKDEKFETADFNKLSPIIKKAYDLLSSQKGIKYTGASKLLHLMNIELFVMWDGWIRLHYSLKKADSEDYVNFLKKIQSEFKDIKASNGRTLAKLIDEYNYVVITLPALEEQRTKRSKKK